MLQSIISALDWIEAVIINGFLANGFSWIIRIVQLF